MTVTISRHYLTINGRRVHYRRAGKGPPVLLIHQSPRSSAEYEAQMLKWGAHFTCIAPDTPGFGQSMPLAKAEPDINDFADAVAEFVTAMGLDKVPAYGFHSGAFILITALRRHPALFSAIAAGGYGQWTDEERAAFGENYLPPFLPTSYGEHLIWAWNRVLEQSWFFPWYDARPQTRMPRANDNPQEVDAVVREILDAGDSFRLGYAAVLLAKRDIPSAEELTAPVLITAYDGDPMQSHIDRLGKLPTHWEARKVRTAEDQQSQSLAFLQKHACVSPETYAEDADRGFVPVCLGSFNGLIHWQGKRGSKALKLAPPGSEADLIEAGEAIAIDPPGHGLSSPWQGAAPTDWPNWQQVINAAALELGTQHIVFPDLPSGDVDRLYPDLTPDRFGAYLVKAWAKVRAERFFAPWYEANAGNALSFDPADLTPEKLALHHRALIRANAAKAWHLALQKR